MAWSDLSVWSRLSLGRQRVRLRCTITDRPSEYFQTASRDGRSPADSLQKTQDHLGISIGLLLTAVILPANILIFTGRDAGKPLPVVEYSTAIDPATRLPPSLRLVGALPLTNKVWVHRYSFRSDRHHDIYTPLLQAGAAAGTEANLLVEDVIFVDDNGKWRSPPAALEGRIKRAAVPRWMIDAMRASGISVIDHPVLLKRDDLNGVKPKSDRLLAIFLLLFGSLMNLAIFVQARKIGTR